MYPIPLTEGERYSRDGVTFTFHPDIPKLIERTESDPAGFNWRFLLMGKVIVAPEGGEHTASDGALLVGEHQHRMHALALPVGAGPCHYGVSAEGDHEIEIVTKSGLLGGTKLKSAKVIVNDHLAVNAFAIDEYTPRGFARKRHAEFSQTFG